MYTYAVILAVAILAGICIYMYTYVFICIHLQWHAPYRHAAIFCIHSQRRSDLKCLDLHICPLFPDNLLSARDSVYSREILFENLKTSGKTCWIWLLWKLVGNFGSRNYFMSDLFCLEIYAVASAYKCVRVYMPAYIYIDIYMYMQ